MNSFVQNVILGRWPLCRLLFLLVACNPGQYNNIPVPIQKDSLKEVKIINAALDSIHSNETIVMQGDIIMRTGRDFTSETMRNLCTNDKTYSHCGIASFENDSLFVYHAIGGEWNPDQKLRRDPFDFFCNPFENRGFGIFRYKLTPGENQRLIGLVHKFYGEGIMFDMRFDLASDDRMYCTEFVYKLIEGASKNKISLSTTTLNHVRFVAPDNLFINPDCTEIKRVIFNR